MKKIVKNTISWILKKALSLIILVAKLIFLILKLLPTEEGKVVFISRQTDKPSLDFRMIRDELIRRKLNIKMIFLTVKLEKKVSSITKFVLLSISSMYHLATSSVCILDSYWPTVSIFNQKKSLFVIQIWHSIGKIKKSGYQTVGMKYGINKIIVETMCLYKGYDMIITGAKSMEKFYCESFGATPSQLVPIGLPRIDYMLANKNTARHKFEKLFPDAKNKKIILYTPTFRGNDSLDFAPIIQAFGENDNFFLVIRPHRKQYIDNVEKIRKYQRKGILTINILCACDYVITDFSAISFEATVLRKKLLFYTPDYKRYIKNNGVNIDVKNEFPNLSFDDIYEIRDNILANKYSYDSLNKFAENYVPHYPWKSTEKISDFIETALDSGKETAIDRVQKERITKEDLVLEQ